MAMIEHPAHSLTFGDLVWVEEGANPPDESGVTYRVRAQDATFGTAVPVTTALMWLGRTGGPVSWDSTPNREPVFRITVEADDSDLLARGERALQLQCERPTALTWIPPDGAGEPSVFDVVWSHLEPIFDRDGLTGVGMEEAVLRTRTYLVRMQALPYARSRNLVVTATQPAAVETILDDGSSAAAWSSEKGSVASTGGAIVHTYSTGFYASLNRAGSLAAGAVLAVTWKSSGAASNPRVVLNTTTLVLESAREPGTSGYVTSYFQVPDTITLITDLAFVVNLVVSGTTMTLSIDKVASWTALPFIGTARQKALALVPGGSVRTQGSVHVTHATSPLGTVVVFTHPTGTGYLPPLRRWRSASLSVTTDSARVSGARNTLGDGGPGNPTEFLLPMPAAPVGTTEIWAFLKADSTTTHGIGAQIISFVDGDPVGINTLTSAPIAFTSGTWRLYCIGSFTSPVARTGPGGELKVVLYKDGGGPNIEIDEAYLFATDTGSLTVVDLGTGTASAGGPSRHLWIDAPSLDEPMGAIWRGHTADRSDAWHAGANADVWGSHDFDPLGTAVFVVTANTTDADTSLEHYRRSNTFIARES